MNSIKHQYCVCYYCVTSVIGTHKGVFVYIYKGRVSIPYPIHKILLPIDNETSRYSSELIEVFMRFEFRKSIRPKHIRSKQQGETELQN